MSEKMTDEDVEFELSQALSASRAERVRAHITALEAELAEQKALNRRLVDEQCALTARAEQAEKERDEARSEATKLLNDARRLIRERDDARAEAAAAFLAGKAEAREDVERADAANAALLDVLKRWVAADGDSDVPDMGNPKNAAAFALYMVAADLVEKPHPGAAMLDERQRITKTLDRMDVPSGADEAEMGRTCDLAGRVELLATWGQRGWREYRRLKDAEPALLERLRALKRVLEAARPLVPLVIRGSTPEAALFDAISAADALKEEATPSPVQRCAGCGHAMAEHDAIDGCKAITNDPKPGDTCPCVELVTNADRATPPELTTAEAFATVRGHHEAVAMLFRLPEDREQQARVNAALSLLERRMGAMGRAIRMAMSALDGLLGDSDLPDDDRPGVRAMQALQAALTDAPDVFTREEVRNACEVVADDCEPGPVALTDDAAEAYASGWARGARTVPERLDALRKR